MKIHVRIPVAYSTYHEGWNAVGWSCATDEENAHASLDPFDSRGRIVAWIEADVDVPEEFNPPTIQGTVT